MSISSTALDNGAQIPQPDFDVRQVARASAVRTVGGRFHAEHGIATEAWSPLGQGRRLPANWN